jgi:hypothetical protein
MGTDDQLLTRLHAPPDLQDGMESLEYWRDRSKRLAWYRLRARREAKLMAVRWEQRVRLALLSQRGVPWGARISAGLLLGRMSLQRLRFRTALVVMGVIAAALVILPFALAVFLLAQIF